MLLYVEVALEVWLVVVPDCSSSIVEECALFQSLKYAIVLVQGG